MPRDRTYENGLDGVYNRHASKLIATQACLKGSVEYIHLPNYALTSVNINFSLSLILSIVMMCHVCVSLFNGLRGDNDFRIRNIKWVINTLIVWIMVRG